MENTNDVSEKQMEANRQNAKLGGVKSEEGKAVSRFNALKHGLLSKEVLLKDENKDELEELGKRFKSELRPATELEMLLVDRIVANAWRLKRALKIENQIIAHSLKEPDFASIMTNTTEKNIGQVFHQDSFQADVYGKFIRYEASIERGLYKALHELQRTQAARLGGNVPLPIAIDVDISGAEQMGSFGKDSQI